MKDQDLTRLLRDLPRESARPGFRTRVLARVAESAPRRRRLRLATVGVAALAVAMAAASLLWWRDVQAERREIARHRVETLRNEYSDLEAEMRQLRRLVAASEPVVAFEGEGDVDYLVDLHELSRASGGEAFPISYRLPE